MIWYSRCRLRTSQSGECAGTTPWSSLAVSCALLKVKLDEPLRLLNVDRTFRGLETRVVAQRDRVFKL